MRIYIEKIIYNDFSQNLNQNFAIIRNLLRPRTLRAGKSKDSDFILALKN